MMVANVSAVILSYNRRSELACTLEALRSQTCESMQVIVVDNASTDGTVEMLRASFPDVEVVALTHNRGIGGWNEGFAIARGEYVLVLDDDSAPMNDDTVELALTRVKEVNCDVLACRVVNLDGSRSELDGLERGMCSTFIGCGAIFKKAALNACGGFFAPLFIYAHEIEYSMRLRERGFTIHYDPDVCIAHRKNEEHRGPLLGAQLSTRELYYGFRNHVFLILAYMDRIVAIRRLFRMLLGRGLFFLIHEGSTPFIKGFISGIGLWWRHRNSFRPLSPNVQEEFQHGGYFGGFFSDGKWGFQRPKSMMIEVGDK